MIRYWCPWKTKEHTAAQVGEEPDIENLCVYIYLRDHLQQPHHHNVIVALATCWPPAKWPRRIRKSENTVYWLHGIALRLPETSS